MWSVILFFGQSSARFDMKALTLRHLVFFTAAACLCLALAGHSAAQLPRIRVPRPAPTKTQPLPAETTANKGDGNNPTPLLSRRINRRSATNLFLTCVFTRI